MFKNRQTGFFETSLILFYFTATKNLNQTGILNQIKYFKFFSITILTTVILSSCGVHTAMVGNINNNVTSVELSNKNYKILDKVTGQSSATYVLGIGGLANKSLVEKAKAKMLESADLSGSAKAVIYMTTEPHITIVYPFFYQKTITVSGYIVEFTD